MEQSMEKNRVDISGKAESDLEFNHTLFGENFYLFYIRTPRLSGVDDVLPVTVSERLLGGRAVKKGEDIYIYGQLRSYNKHIDGANRLIITIFALEISFIETQCVLNELIIDGYVCKAPVYRTTPFQREITDLLIAVNRSYHKSDYLPCIAWGRNARFAATLEVGSRVIVSGRVQSREYKKTIQDGETTIRMAYEVSVSKIDPKIDAPDD